MDSLHHFLLKAHLAGKTTVLVIDEAQNLSRDVLEQIRLVSNLETATDKLLQIVLIGQSELNDLLAQRDLRQLAQRVTARYHLGALDLAEMTQYIRHRLRVVRGIGKVGFTTGALREIHRFSQGVPRLVNLLCDRSLLAGYVLNRRTIDRSIVRQAIRELNYQPRKGKGIGGWVRRRLSSPIFNSLIGVLLLAAFGLGLSVAERGLADPVTSPRSLSTPLQLGDVVRADAEPEGRLESYAVESSPRISQSAPGSGSIP